MVSRHSTHARALAAGLSLAGLGCAPDGPAPTDDDDSTAAGVDRSAWDGFEYVDIDWSEDSEAAGLQDCTARWAAEAGPGEPSWCAGCDLVWDVQLYALDGSESCLDNTGLPFAEEARIRLGAALEDDTRFRAWRGEPDVTERGRGALSDDGFTWSGRDGYQQQGTGFRWWWSGEGAF